MPGFQLYQLSWNNPQGLFRNPQPVKQLFSKISGGRFERQILCMRQTGFSFCAFLPDNRPFQRCRNCLFIPKRVISIKYQVCLFQVYHNVRQIAFLFYDCFKLWKSVRIEPEYFDEYRFSESKQVMNGSFRIYLLSVFSSKTKSVVQMRSTYNILQIRQEIKLCQIFFRKYTISASRLPPS